jgi:hypothetical protein
MLRYGIKPQQERVGRRVQDVARPGLLASESELADGEWHMAGCMGESMQRDGSYWECRTTLDTRSLRRSVDAGAVVSVNARLPDGTMAWFVKMAKG